MQFGFGLLCLSCRTPFVNADQGSMSNPSKIQCSSILAQLPGVSKTSAQLEESQESGHVTAVRVPGEGSQLLTTKGFPSFPSWTRVGCLKPCNHGQKKRSSTMHNLSSYLPRIPLTSQLFLFNILGGCSALEASSFRQSSACSQATDRCHVNVSAGFCVRISWFYVKPLCCNLNKIYMYHEE